MNGPLQLVELVESAGTAFASQLKRGRATVGSVVDLDTAAGDLERVERLRVPTVRVLRESATYRPDRPHSWFADLAGEAAGDTGAAERLARHRREVEDLRSLERRDVTMASFGGLIPPAFLADLVVASTSPDTPVSALWAAPIPLPDSGSEVVIPRFTTAATAGSAAENVLPSESNPATSGTAVPVRTIWSVTDMSVQLLDRGGPVFDVLAGRELAAAAAAELERQVVAGDAASSELVGVLNMSGTTGTTATAASADAVALGEFIAKLSQAVSSVAGRVRGRVLVMHPRRADVLTLGPRTGQLTVTPADPSDPPGTLLRFGGIPVLVSSGIAATFGAGNDEDRVILTNPAAAVLLTGPLSVDVSNPGTGIVRLSVRQYAALVPRRPAQIGIMSGTALSRTL